MHFCNHSFLPVAKRRSVCFFPSIPSPKLSTKKCWSSTLIPFLPFASANCNLNCISSITCFASVRSRLAIPVSLIFEDISLRATATFSTSLL